MSVRKHKLSCAFTSYKLLYMYIGTFNIIVGPPCKIEGCVTLLVFVYTCTCSHKTGTGDMLQSLMNVETNCHDVLCIIYMTV